MAWLSRWEKAECVDGVYDDAPANNIIILIMLKWAQSLHRSFVPEKKTEWAMQMHDDAADDADDNNAAQMNTPADGAVTNACQFVWYK